MTHKILLIILLFISAPHITLGQHLESDTLNLDLLTGTWYQIGEKDGTKTYTKTIKDPEKENHFKIEILEEGNIIYGSSRKQKRKRRGWCGNELVNTNQKIYAWHVDEFNSILKVYATNTHKLSTKRFEILKLTSNILVLKFIKSH